MDEEIEGEFQDEVIKDMENELRSNEDREVEEEGEGEGDSPRLREHKGQVERISAD